MALCIINGISVSFPYEPYKVQEEYMNKVITCLKNGTNGILESPTGTGKTLSLLCSSLAWLENRKAQQQLALIERSTNKDIGLLNDLKHELGDINGCWDTGPVLLLPKVIYSSRTHSQLSQAVQELKRSNYKHVKSVVLGSRDQLCLHADVLKLPSNTSKVHACHAKISSKSCPYYLNYEEKIISTTEYQETPVTDIEDLVRLGKKHRVCPYYAARKLRTDADIIFTPYNYIIDPKSRRAHGTELQGNVLIFDEAHNIESACEESLSFQLRSYDLALCITELSQTMDKIKDFDSKDFNSSDNGAPDFTLTDLSILKVMLCELEEILDKAVAENAKNNGVKPGDYIFELLSKVEITAQKKEIVVELLDKIILYNFTSTEGMMGAKGFGLQRFCDLLNILYSKSPAEGYSEASLKEEFSTKYKVCLQYETQNKSKTAADPWASTTNKKQSWKLDFWCFSPNVRMQEIVDKGVHSVILTSGTLSPLGPMIAELGVDFPVQLENPHIIKDFQVFVGVVTCGPDGTPLNSSFQNRSNEAYVNSLGRTISNFSRVVPDGLLVFFPSYSVLKSNQESWEDNGTWRTLSGVKPLFVEPQGSNEAYVNSLGRTISNFGRVVPDGLLVFFPSYSVLKSNQESWEDNGTWRTLSGVKPLFVEPQGKDAFQESIEKYYSTIQDSTSKGATLMAVCRGKVSEGLDFADQNARGVIITGLPFPPIFDPRIKLKMEYLNSIAKASKGSAVNGNDWYMLQASRAVNQAIGRVIRHKNDFGAILLCDNRFQQKRIQEHLSKWIHGRITIFDSFGPALRQLSSFFKNLDQDSLKPKPDALHVGSFRVNGSVLYSASLPGKHASQEKKPSENIENILESYKIEKNGESSSCKSLNSSSIFDEFEKAPAVKSALKPSSSSLILKEEIISESDSPKEPKRRKLCVQLRSANEPEKETKSPAEKWKKYLIEVKALLKTADKYGGFCSSIKEYKASKDVEKFATALMSVFDGIPDRQKYIQTASFLIETKHRENFLSFCFKDR